MTFFPAGFDRHAAALHLFHLVNVNTPDGDFGFILGADGKFTDVNGKDWWGSRLIRGDGVGFGLGGTAKASSITLCYFDDPAAPSTLSEDIRQLGAEYVKGRALTRYLQVFTTPEERLAPVHPPRQASVMEMDHITQSQPNALTKTITLHLEGSFRARGAAARKVYNTSDHSQQLGYANPSYEFIPTEPREEEGFLA